MMADSYVVNYSVNPTITNIEHSDIEYLNIFSKRIVFYNPEVDEPLHKFWYYLPKVKIINMNKNIIRIVFSNKDLIINSINSLDEKTADIMQTVFGDDQNISPSITIRPNYPPTFDLICDTRTKIFDSSNKQIDASELDNGINLMMYIEFDSVVITSNKFFRKWRVVQMKCLKNIIDTTENLFEQKLQQPAVIHMIPQAPPLFFMHSPPTPPNEITVYSPAKVMNNNFPQPMNRDSQKDKNVPCEFVPPTKDQLTEMRNRLKKKSDNKPNNQSDDRKNGLNQLMDEFIIKKKLMEDGRKKELIRKYINECQIFCEKDINEIQCQNDQFNELCLLITTRIIANDQLIENDHLGEEQSEEQVDEEIDQDDPFLLPFTGKKSIL